MRIRKPFAAVFAGLLLVSGYLGLARLNIPAIGGYQQSDKGLHFVTFFLLTITFYWVFETSRRRALHITLVVCVAALACGSEILQGLLPNNRDFDPYDVLANVIGSACALGLCQWYHRRMLERKRASKTYASVSSGNPDDEEANLGVELEPQESGITSSGQRERNVDIDAELDNWDENAADEDWEDAEPTQKQGQVNGVSAAAVGVKAGGGGLSEGEEAAKKRDD